MFTPIDIGQTVKPVAIERYKGVKDGKDIICILSRKIAGATTHYHSKTGSFFCWGGRCCQEMGLARIRYILPVLVYSIQRFPTNYGAPLTLKYLEIGKDAYETDILTKEQIVGDITKVDIAAVCTDSQYQKMRFDTLNGVSMWRRDPEMAKLVQELYREYQALIEMSVARNLDEASMLKLLAEEDKDQGRGNNRPAPAAPAPAPVQRRQVAQSHVGQIAHTPAPAQPAAVMVDLDSPTNVASVEGLDLSPAAPAVTQGTIPSGVNFQDLIDDALQPNIPATPLPTKMAAPAPAAPAKAPQAVEMTDVGSL